MDLSGYSMVAQIMLSIITFVGIVASLWLSIKALREVQTDRKLRQRPYLGFEIGGYEIPIEFQKAGRTIPGIDPDFVKKMFPDIPEDAESVRIRPKMSEHGTLETTFYGQLRNYGLGPALSTAVTWVPEEIWIGSEKTSLGNEKLLEPQYREILNCMPSVPSHILPSKNAGLARLPTFIEKDYRKKITRVEGFLKIECKDVFGEKHLVTQEFYLFTYYTSDPPHIHVTFGDFVERG
ncbi:MAG TPA: hypothetical protein VMS94_02730 [Acidobacteriota bacterium]|nr:hypothetical protein [Acidobacteriota bacterium]